MMFIFDCSSLLELLEETGGSRARWGLCQGGFGLVVVCP